VPHADVLGDRIALTTRWTEAELVKQVPGARWSPDDKMWFVPLTWAACLQLRGLFRNTLEVGDELALWSQREWSQRVGPSLEMRSRLTRVDGWSDRLYDFQTAGAEFLLGCGEGGLLADDLGLGKTAQVLAVIQGLTELDPADALPALVICPNGVKLGWERQIALWQTPVTPYVLTGGTVGRRKMLERARQDPGAVVIVNTEAVRLLARLAPYGSTRLKRCRECDKKRGEEKLTPARCEVHPKPLNGFGFRTVILDEAHSIVNPLSKQTRACWSVGHDPSVRRRWATTGTPIASNVGDVWSIMHFLVPREHPTKTQFVDRYALRAWNAHGGLDIVGVAPDTRDEFFRIIDPRFRRTPKAVVLDQLPPIVRSVRWVDMSPRQASVYREMHARSIAVTDDGQILVSPNNLVKATRLLQLSSSYANVEWVEQLIPTREMCDCAANGGTRHVTNCPGSECWCTTTGDKYHNEGCSRRLKCVVTLAEPSSKLDALEEDLLSLGGRRVVVAAESRQLIGLAEKRLIKLKIPFGVIAGDVGDTYERQDVIRRFNEERIQAVLLTIGAGGVGLDGLQCADTLLCVQRSWSMLKNVQLDGRVHRIGSEVHDSVHIVEYVARDTIEETTLYPRLVSKWERLDEITRDRARLHAAGIKPDEAYRLDLAESRVVNSFLGLPESSE